MISRKGLDTGIALASAMVVAAVTAMHALGNGPITTRDWLTLGGAVVVAVLQRLSTAPADQPPKDEAPAPAP